LISTFGGWLVRRIAQKTILEFAENLAAIVHAP
jgi:hypothetical protein